MPITGSDVQAYMAAAGLTLPAGIDFDEAAEEAVAWVEELSGYRPLEAGVADVSRYDPPGPKPAPGRSVLGGSQILQFDGGYVSVDEIRIHATSDTDGDVLTLGEDYDLEPRYGPRDGACYKRVRFRYPIRGLPGSIAIEGRRGYCETLPAWLKGALIAYAAHEVATQIREGMLTDIVEVKVSDGAERKSIELIQRLGEAWHSEATRKIRPLMRWS